MFARNIGIRSGIAPARTHIPELLPDVLAGRIIPVAVFTKTADLAGTPAGYAAMDTRNAIKVLIRP